MADIFFFPSQKTKNPDAEPGRCGKPNQARDGSLSGPALGRMSRLDQMMEEIAELYEDTSLPECTYCRFNGREDEDFGSAECDLASLTELVVFSPEIQKVGLQPSDSEEKRTGTVRWGDVFVKSGDVYPFLFTLYTEDYVKHQLASYGERIVSSTKDIILRKPELSPPDIVRAVIKWVNLHSPEQFGKRVRLESTEVLRDLVCDPGVEVLVADPT